MDRRPADDRGGHCCRLAEPHARAWPAGVRSPRVKCRCGGRLRPAVDPCNKATRRIKVPAALFYPPSLPTLVQLPSGSLPDMYFFAWLRWVPPSGTRVLHGSLSIFYFGPARSHGRGGDDRNQNPLGPDDAFADGGP